MNNRLAILLAALVVSSIQTFGQIKSCETVYQTVDNNPTYDGGMNALMDYFGKYLTPIINKYHKKDEELTAKLTMTITIDVDGKVVDVALSKHKLPTNCVNEIKNELLTMTGWTPGSLNGQKVCCKFSWIISCIKWN